MKTAQKKATDMVAISLSTACLIHCVALPLVGAFLPALGVFSENELVHQILVLLAIPVTLYAVSAQKASSMIFRIGALVGLAVLSFATFGMEGHPQGENVVILGAVILISAHLWRLIRR